MSQTCSRNYLLYLRFSFIFVVNHSRVQTVDTSSGYVISQNSRNFENQTEGLSLALVWESSHKEILQQFKDTLR